MFVVNRLNETVSLSRRAKGLVRPVVHALHVLRLFTVCAFVSVHAIENLNEVCGAGSARYVDWLIR